MKHIPTKKNFLFALTLGAAALFYIEAPAQLTPASILLSNNVDYPTINLSADYLLIEESISRLALKIKSAHQKYPGLQYAPAYSHGEIIGFMVSGVPESSFADKLASDLMQLDLLGQIVQNMDINYLPAIAEEKIRRVKRKQARL